MMRIPVTAIAFGAASMGGTAAIDYIEKSSISLPTACGVGVTVIGVVWWLSSKLTTIEDTQRVLKDSIDNLACRKNGCSVLPPKGDRACDIPKHNAKK